MKIINEEVWEYNQSVQYIFVDFQKAHDPIHRDMLWKCMEEFKIPTKLINMCEMCVQKTRSAVRIEGTLSFKKKKGRTETGQLFITIIIEISIAKTDTKYTDDS
jgi:hypothetical protein